MLALAVDVFLSARDQMNLAEPKLLSKKANLLAYVWKNIQASNNSKRIKSVIDTGRYS